jgi:hypothetical protein
VIIVTAKSVENTREMAIPSNGAIALLNEAEAAVVGSGEFPADEHSLSRRSS